jgi:hypothetical protein
MHKIPVPMLQAVATLLLVPPLLLVSPSDASAQCIACTSSHSCDEGDRGGCEAVCDSTGHCECGDDLCKPQVERAQVVTYELGVPTYIAEQEGRALLVSDCRGYVIVSSIQRRTYRGS